MNELATASVELNLVEIGYLMGLLHLDRNNADIALLVGPGIFEKLKAAANSAMGVGAPEVKP